MVTPRRGQTEARFSPGLTIGSEFISGVEHGAEAERSQLLFSTSGSPAMCPGRERRIPFFFFRFPLQLSRRPDIPRGPKK